MKLSKSAWAIVLATTLATTLLPQSVNAEVIWNYTTNSTTGDTSDKRTYRVALGAGVIEETIQQDGQISKRELSCVGLPTIVPNPNQQPPYLAYESGG